MICRMRLRVAPALGQSSASTARLNVSPEPPDEQRDHQPADHLHQVDVRAGTNKAAEGREQHPVAAGEQQQDRQPHPEKEFLEGDPHQPMGSATRQQGRPRTCSGKRGCRADSGSIRPFSPIGRSSSVGFDRYRVGPDPNTEGSDATAPAASSGQKGGMTNVRPQAARRARPAPERDDPLVVCDVRKRERGA